GGVRWGVWGVVGWGAGRGSAGVGGSAGLGSVCCGLCEVSSAGPKIDTSVQHHLDSVAVQPDPLLLGRRYRRTRRAAAWRGVVRPQRRATTTEQERTCPSPPLIYRTPGGLYQAPGRTA